MKISSVRLSRKTLAASIGLATWWMIGGTALAQGGPPLVTDDPETPGDGHWEINIAVTGARTSQRREFSAPDADINYGWGEHIQLKLDIPWVYARDEPGQPWKSGLGAPNIGVKWRFIDIEDAGFSMSTYPQLTRNWLSSSTRRGLTDAGQQFFLPVEVSTVMGKFGLDAEVGRNFVQGGTNETLAGVVVAHDCGENLECMAEVHETYVPHNSQTLVNLGVHWKLSESLVLLAAAGREFGPSSDDQKHLLYYFGIQILR